MPNLITLRPGDANETAQAWKLAIEQKEKPTALILSRQAIPTLDREKFACACGVAKGAYVLADLGDGPIDLVLIASGAELDLVVKAGETLAEEGVNVRIISMPSQELFVAQPNPIRMK